MTETPDPSKQTPVTPSRSDRLRPAELLFFAGILAVFAGVVIALTTRQWATAGIAFGIVFIVVTMVLALLGLGGKPSEEDVEARKDLQQPEDGGARWH